MKKLWSCALSGVLMFLLATPAQAAKVGEHYLLKGQCVRIVKLKRGQAWFQAKRGRKTTKGRASVKLLKTKCRPKATRVKRRAAKKGALKRAAKRRAVRRRTDPSKRGGQEGEEAPKTEPAPLPSDHVAALVAAHNAARTEVGVPALKWSPAVASYAQSWATHLQKEKACGLQHRSGSTKQKPWGENLAMWTGDRPVQAGVGMWHAEKADWDGGALSGANLAKIGHWTQMVWRSTTKVGCGVATCGGRTVLVCNYDPPGNFMGQKPF